MPVAAETAAAETAAAADGTAQNIDEEEQDQQEYFRAVSCASCGTEVGAFDQDEVYHFFGVVPGYG